MQHRFGQVDVCDTSQEKALLARLQKLDQLARRGLVAEAGDVCGVVISYGGHVRGIWHFDRGRFLYTPAGYNASTHQAGTVDDAVRITLTLT
jgi:hypothetical protein